MLTIYSDTHVYTHIFFHIVHDNNLFTKYLIMTSISFEVILDDLWNDLGYVTGYTCKNTYYMHEWINAQIATLETYYVIKT